MADLDIETLKELFSSRFDAFEAKLSSLIATLEKENNRQDEAIERLADRMTHSSETKRLTQRVEKLEAQREIDRAIIDDLKYKVRLATGIGVFIAGILASIITALIKGWIGI